MLYDDLVAENNNSGIYTELVKAFTNDKDIDLVNAIVTSKDLDNRFLFENKGKDCLFDDLNLAVSVLKAKYYAKWKALINAFLNGKLKDGATTETISNGTSNSTDKVSAYDSDDLIDDSGNNTTANNDTTTYDITGLTFVQSVYKNNFVYDTINTDIRRTLFSNVYSIKINDRSELTNASHTN